MLHISTNAFIETTLTSGTDIHAPAATGTMRHQAEGMVMTQLPVPSKPCPAGLDDCPVLVEIEYLQQECHRLVKQLEIDPLTRWYNVNHLFSALEQEMERSRRTGMATGLIMIDLDHFKQINDTFGHETGNKVLSSVCELWREKLRRIDIACRYGGEEFAVILPGTRLGHSIRTAERLRAIVEASPVPMDGRSIRITASFGVDVYSPLEQLTANEFVQRADQFLLQAKALGRNRVVHRTSEPSREPTEISAEERAMLFIGRWPKM
jgi:diguanylate cyclase (GGDEF)-like protein